MKPKPKPCDCDAYPFPHRPFGGECMGGDIDYRCDGCPYLETETDPYCTGDRWYSESICTADKCEYRS
jgi:hypothetical protein